MGIINKPLGNTNNNDNIIGLIATHIDNHFNIRVKFVYSASVHWIC